MKCVLAEPPGIAHYLPLWNEPDFGVNLRSKNLWLILGHPDVMERMALL